jgi:hypothetical protein
MVLKWGTDVHRQRGRAEGARGVDDLLLRPKSKKRQEDLNTVDRSVEVGGDRFLDVGLRARDEGEQRGTTRQYRCRANGQSNFGCQIDGTVRRLTPC